MSKLEELYTRACEKLDREAGGDGGLQVIAAYMRERAVQDVSVCMAILEESKTLAGAYDAIKKAAEAKYNKNRKERMVCVTPQEAYAIVDTYYAVKAEAAPAPEKPPAAENKVISLFDML